MSKKYLLAFALFAAFTSQSRAGFINGGFETGNFTGWNATAGTAVGNDILGIGTPPPQGTFNAAFSAGTVSNAGLESFFGLGAGTLNPQLGVNGFGGSGISQTLTVNAGDKLSLQWDLILQDDQNDSTFNDTAFAIIGSTAVLLANSFTPLSSDGFTTGYQTFSYTFPASGTFTVGAGVMNGGDNQFNSFLYADNFSILDANAAPAPPAIAIFAIGSFGLAGLRRLRK